MCNRTLNLDKIITDMVANGVAHAHAVALVTAIEYALGSEDFARLYGTYWVEKLDEFVVEASM
jgi:hypothetical protein